MNERTESCDYHLSTIAETTRSLINRLDDIPTVSLIFNRLDSWQQLFNVLGRGNGSRGYHLCA